MQIDTLGRSDTGFAEPALEHAVKQRIGLLRWRDAGLRPHAGDVADEVPIAFEYNGIAHAVMLATPADLEEFALGFSLSEGVIDSIADLYGIEARREVRRETHGITLELDVAAAAFVRLKERRRTLAGRTGCGICGTESLDQVLRPLPDLSAIDLRVTPAALLRASNALADVQPLQRLTGAAHGAAWCSVEGTILLMREDVGRHNALDKLIGAMTRADVDPRAGFVLITSRASMEMVQKSATVGIGVLAAVSAPTAAAVRMAQGCGQTLVGFVRSAEFSVYTHPGRVGG